MNDSQHLASMAEPDDGPRDAGAAAPATDAKAAPPPTNWWAELRAIFWLVLAVIGFHSLIAKPFYIPSESMMPGLLKGDRLVVSKYPYGWSWVSPSFHVLPHWRGRLWGAMPERGDVVIITPPGDTTDYIKRVVGLPGDRIKLVGGQLYLNGAAVPQERRPDLMLPIDANIECPAAMVAPGDGNRPMCRLPIVREILPNGRAYDTIDSGYYPESDNFGPIMVPEGHVFVMGDNRDSSADSRFPLGPPNNGLGGPVPWENLGGRAEFVTFSLDGSSQWWNPISWFTALRGGRSGTSLHPDRVEAPAGPAR